MGGRACCMRHLYEYPVPGTVLITEYSHSVILDSSSIILIYTSAATGTKLLVVVSSRAIRLFRSVVVRPCMCFAVGVCARVNILSFPPATAGHNPSVRGTNVRSTAGREEGVYVVYI